MPATAGSPAATEDANDKDVLAKAIMLSTFSIGMVATGPSFALVAIVKSDVP